MTDKLRIFSLTPQEAKLDNGQTIYLKRLTASDRVDWLTYITTKGEGKAEDGLRIAMEDSIRLLAKSIADKEGNRLFTDDEAEQLKQIDAMTLDRLASETLTLNGMGSEGKDELKKK
jgi:hypothetical protein